jgi:hypothetical protein
MTYRERRSGLWRLVLTAVVLLLAAGAAQPDTRGGGDEDEDDGSFGFSKPIACKEVRGYEDYDPLPGAALTHDEKLIIYYLPRHFKTERKGKKYRVHFTQQGRIRRRGQKAVIWSLPKTLEYKDESDGPPRSIFLTNKLALKALPPGDYEYEIVLNDAVGGSTAATRTLPFTILPSPDPKAPAPEKDEPARP